MVDFFLVASQLGILIFQFRQGSVQLHTLAGRRIGNAVFHIGNGGAVTALLFMHIIGADAGNGIRLIAVHIDESFEEAGALLKDLTFVITGSLNYYANRDELKALIESLGGKVSGSVSAKTSYLINNDTTSTSGKNKKAKELGIAVIDEEKIKNCIESEDLSLLMD